MKLSFLVDNKTEHSKCQAEWGLALFIESEGHKILFDTGCSDMFIRNAKAMGIDLTEAEAVLVSHGHYDHTEGMPAFVELNRTAPIYIHKNAFYKCYGTNKKGIDDWHCGLWWSDEFRKSIEDRFILTENAVKVTENMTLIGNIPDFEEYPPTEVFHREIEPGKLIPDDMSHEQFLVVEEGDHIIIISGCCHRGAVPTIKTAQKYFPDKKIAAFIAGMHMYSLNDERRKKMVGEILELGVEKIFPVHCTGMEAIMEFKARMGDGCVVATSGDVYEL